MVADIFPLPSRHKKTSYGLEVESDPQLKFFSEITTRYIFQW